MGCYKRIALCAALLPGCYSPPASDERFDDSIVVTARDSAADFQSFQTFFLRPEIRVLDENDLDEGIVPETLDPATAQPMLDETRQNLLDRGYVEAATKEEANLAVEVLYLRALFSSYYCYYWWDYGYWGYPGYYYYYPYSCDTTAWRSGMVVTNVTDLAAAGPPPTVAPTANAVLRGVWFSGVYGVESDSSALLVDRAVDGIDQAFVQSPYFSATP